MLLLDEPTTWPMPEGDWSPGNYDDEYDGLITLRRALALSRNIATIKLAEQTGFDTRRGAVAAHRHRHARRCAAIRRSRSASSS